MQFIGSGTTECMRFLLSMTALFIATTSFAAEPITIPNGKNQQVILIPSKPSPAERFAADELAKYINRISGVDLKVHHAVATEVPKQAIIVTEQEHLAEFGPRHFQNLSKQDGYSISESGETIQLVGASGRSTLYAVYQFLDGLGCRFLAPELNFYNRAAEVLPEKLPIVINDKITGVSEPKLKFRKLYVEEGHSHNIENLKQMVEWMPKVGYNTLVIPTDYSGGGRVKWDNWREALTPELQKRDITIEVGGHGYQNFLNATMEGGTLFDKHPDWFGQDKQGKRRKERGQVFCTSNAAAVD
jgi:hypothetical protein